MNKRHRSLMPLRVKAVTLAVASCFAASVQTPAFANPTGFAVVNGQVTFNYNGNTLNITNTPGSIINWQRFSIGSNELTRFIQQSAASSVLNRVVGIDPSLILGALQSNGRVFLINPNGILFGAGAQIDVGGLVASSLNLSNQDFLAGRLRFTETPGAGSVVNNAAITTPTGGQVYLIAPSVQNSGIITSPQGEVILAAGRSVELVDAGTPNLRVEITAPDTEAINVGQIIANSGKIGIYAGLIRNSGVIRADGVVLGEHGEIMLKATGNTNLESGGVVAANGAQGGNITIQSGDTTLVSGVVEAKGGEGQGGSVQLLGNNVGVLDGARIDASGQTGGGTVLVGGDYQGRNPDIQNAFRTYVGPDASIRADAVANGDGGKVIVWSDDATRMYGSISARGGAQGGNGGFVETSGHSLDVTRGPDVSAPVGTGGTWLLDPVDLNLVAFDPTLGSILVNNTGAPFFSPLGDTSTVSVDLINAQLNFGSNVSLTTTSQGSTAGTQAGNITLSAPILKSAATITGGPVIGTTTLSMTAHNNIVITPTGSITSTGDPLNVTLQGDLDGIGGGGVTVGGGIFTNGGVVSIAGRDLTAINAPINTMRTLTNAGSVSLQSVANAVNVASMITGGSFFANGFTGVSINAPVTTLGGGSVQLFSSTGPVTVAAAINGGFFSANAGGASTLNLAAPITSNGATLTSDDIQITAPLNAGSGGITAQQNTAGAAINFGASGQAKLNNAITTGPLTIGNSSSGAIIVNAPISAGHSSVSFNSGTSFTVNAGATLSTTSPLFVTAPSITVGGAINAQNINFTTDSIAVNSTVTSATDVNISTRTFGRPSNLGVAVDGATSLDFSTAELGNLVNGGSNALRITATGGALTVQGPISRTGTQSLALTGASIGQAPGATLNVTNLKLTGLFGSVILPEANTVGTLAGTAAGVGGQFTFTEAAGTPLTIGAVDGTNGLRFNQINGTINLSADSLNVTNFISAPFSNGAVVIQPVTASTKLNLGGADAAGTLGISAAELALIQATTLTLKANQADITAPVTSAATTLAIAPITAARALNIVGGAKSPTSLDFTAAELGFVTANAFVLGDPATGPVTVNTATSVPGIVSTFGLRSGDTATGITVNSALTANGNLSLLSDVMNLNTVVTATTGNITIAPNSAGRAIDLGTKTAGTLGLNATELNLLSAPAGEIFGNSTSGDLTVSAPVTLANPTSLIANVMNINSSLTTSAGDITVAPGASRNITLGTNDVVGSSLGFTSAELNNFVPADGTGILRIGDFTNTNAITVTAAIAPANTSTLSLLARSTISQTAGSTIAEPNLRVSSSSGSVSLTEPLNQVGTLAGSSSGSFSFTGGSPGTLTVGVVDGVTGISDSVVTLRADNMSINSNISASSVTLTPLFAGTQIDVGGPDVVSTTLGITQAEFNRIFATSVSLGDVNSGAITVSAPVTISTFSNLTLTNNGLPATVSNALTVPGTLSINAGAVNTSAALTSSFGNIVLMADSMTFGAGVSASSGTISLQPRNSSTLIDLGGPDVALSSPVLGLDATDISKLSAAAFSIGNGTTPSITVSAATTLSAPSTLTTAGGGTGTINVNAALSDSGNLTLTTDNLIIPGAGSVTAPNVTLNTVSFGRTVDLGTLLSITALGLDQATINRITTPGTFTINNAGLINVSAPVSFTNEANLTLHGDTMTIGSTVTSPGGGRIIVAPSTFRPMNLGTNPVAGSLGLTSAEIDRFVTSGVLQLGDTATTSAITISNSIAPAGVSTVTLAANGSISEAVGKTITETNLRINSFGSVNLPENNSVGTLAGSSSGSFTFTDVGALTIGTVDGVSGITDSTVTIKADTLTLSQPISAGTVTLAPRLAGAPIDLGSKPAGVFGITDAEMDTFLASPFNLTFGTSTAGPVTVSSAMTRSSGLLNITTGAAQTVNVNAALSAPSGVTVTGGSTNVAAPVSSSAGSVTITSDSMNIGAAITSPGTVTLAPLTAARPINLGTETAGALSLTAAEINQVNASSTSSFLTIGSSTSGPLTISAPIAPAGGTTSTSLTLISGGNITQSPSAPIVTKKLNTTTVGGVTTTTPTGSLSVFSTGGQVNLPAANDVGVSLSGSASGAANSFIFTNVGPLKLQNVSVSVSGLGAKILINSAVPLFPPVPVVPIVPSEATLSPFDICALAPEICSLRGVFDDTRYDPDKDKEKGADKNKNICGA